MTGQHGPSAASRDPSVHLLVVVDDAGIRDLITMALEDEGYAVSSASNGCEALHRINEQRPALVLLDLQMPVMSGWEVLQRVRDSHIDVPVVFMTAGYRAREEAERLGTDGYLAKPFDLDDLIRTVTRLAPSNQG